MWLNFSLRKVSFWIALKNLIFWVTIFLQQAIKCAWRINWVGQWIERQCSWREEFKFVLGTRLADVAGDIAEVDNLLDYLIALATATSQNFTRTAYYGTARRAPGCCEWNYDITSTKLRSFEITLRYAAQIGRTCIYLHMFNNLIIDYWLKSTFYSKNILFIKKKYKDTLYICFIPWKYFHNY